MTSQELEVHKDQYPRIFRLHKADLPLAKEETQFPKVAKEKTMLPKKNLLTGSQVN